MRFWVVVPVYNGPELLDRCLESIITQDDATFSVIVADDASDDLRVPAIAASYAVRSSAPVFYEKQATNVRATRNIYEAIIAHKMAPGDVIVLVDGDDRLSHPKVLTRLRWAFKGDIELTYGSYVPEPFAVGCAPSRPIPDEVLANGTIREFHRVNGQWFNHPYCFRRRLFDRLNPVDLMHWIDGDPLNPGEWMRFSYDIALMMPLIEMAGTRARWMHDFLYVYTTDRDEAVWRAHNEEAAAEAEEVYMRERRYAP